MVSGCVSALITYMQQLMSKMAWSQLSTLEKLDGPSCPLWKNLMVPVVHLDISGWSQLSTYVKNGMVPVVHGTTCPTFKLVTCYWADHTNIRMSKYVWFEFSYNFINESSLFLLGLFHSCVLLSWCHFLLYYLSALTRYLLHFWESRNLRFLCRNM